MKREIELFKKAYELQFTAKKPETAFVIYRHILKTYPDFPQKNVVNQMIHVLADEELDFRRINLEESEEEDWPIFEELLAQIGIKFGGGKSGAELTPSSQSEKEASQSTTSQQYMEYMQLVPVVFGVGSVNALPEKVREFSASKIFLVHGRGVKASGIADRIRTSLENAGFQVAAFDRVESDPSDILIDEAATFAREEGIDCIVGVGGGSAMDTAKAVSILMKHSLPMRQYLNLDGPPITIDGGVPTILLPTSAGTGSEVTRVSVITHTGVNKKVPVFTKTPVAIVDPELCLSAPTSVSVDTGFDALAHAMESITANFGNPYSETLAVSAIERIAVNLPRVVKDPKDMEARTEMSLASNFAGIAFSLADVHLGHAAADSISASCHTPHGRNCCWVSAGVQKLAAEAVPEKVRKIGSALGVVFHGGETGSEIGEKTAAAIRSLMRECGVPSMQEAGLDREEILTGAESILESPLLYNCPVEMTEELAVWLLEEAYDGYSG